MSYIDGQADNHKALDYEMPSSSWGENITAGVDKIEENFLDVKNKIAPYNPRIIAVTKYYGLESIINGYRVGLRDFAESRAIDSVKKIEQLPKEIRENSQFHFIGHLQTNKVEIVVKNFDYIHSVDSLKVAQVISKAACSLNKRERVLIQVNNAGEQQKFGYAKEQLIEDFTELIKLEGLEILGLMNMAPLGAEGEELHRLFRELKTLKDDLEVQFEVKMPELSMGMSDDYEIAVAEGSTMIRLGRKLFK